MCTIPPHGSWANHQFELVTTYYRRALADDRRRQEAAGVLPPRPPSGPTGGRHDDPRWRRTHDLDPDSWRSPDDGDRATTPDAGTPVPKDVAGYPAGAGEGRTVASIEEVKAAAGAISAGIAEVQAVLHAQIERIGQEQQLTSGLLQGTGHEAAIAAAYAMQGMVTAMEDAQRAGQEAIEKLQAYTGIL